MTVGTQVLTGVIHGRSIELENTPRLGDGQRVSVVVRPVTPTGEGLRKAFGSWRKDAKKLGLFLTSTYANRADGHRSAR